MSSNYLYDVKEFQRVWNECYSYIQYEPTRTEIIHFIMGCEHSGVRNLSIMVDRFADYVLSQGLAKATP